MIPDKNHQVTRVLLVVYLLVLFWILLFKLGVQFSYMSSRSINLIPFDGLFTPDGQTDKTETMLNILIFIPLGIYIGVLFRQWSFGKKVLTFFMTSFMFEALQFTLKIGAFDITDIITNTVGGTVGLVLFQMLDALFSNQRKAHKFINLITTAGTILVVSLLILLKLNMLPIRYQ